MAGQKIAAVFDAGGALEPAFEQIAAHTHHGQHQADQERTIPAHIKREPTGAPHQRHIKHYTHRAAHRAFPAFTGADGGRELMFAECSAAEIGKNIGNPHQAHNRQQRSGFFCARAQSNQGKPKRHHQQPADAVAFPIGRKRPFFHQPQRHAHQPKHQHRQPDNGRQLPATGIGHHTEKRGKGQITVVLRTCEAAHAAIFPQRQQGNQAGKQRPQGVGCVKKHAQHQRQQD